MRMLALLVLFTAPALAEEPPYDPDADDDPTLPCTVWRTDAETGRRIGRVVVANEKVARAGPRGVARRVDAETVQSADGAMTATWTTDEHDDLFALVVWNPHGIYRSYRFWDDGIFAFELKDGGVQLRYDLMGCDKHELLLGGLGALWATRRR